MQKSICTKACVGCVYNADLASFRYGYCNYIFVENKPRPCPAGKGCTVREVGRKKRSARECPF